MCDDIVRRMERAETSSLITYGGNGEAEAGCPKPMSPLLAVLLAVVRPAQTARRTAGAALWRVWLAFLMSLCLGTFVIVYLNAALDAPELTVSTVLTGIQEITSDMARALRSDPGQFVLAVLAGLVGLHVASALIAFVFMPVGARDEPLRKSFVHSLRQVWLSVARIAFIVFAIGTVGAYFDHVDRNWLQWHPSPTWPLNPVPPNIADFPGDDDGYAKATVVFGVAMAQHEVDIERYEEEYRVWMRGKPWYLVDWEVLIVLASFTLGLTHLCMLMCSMTVRRLVPPIERPPTCEFCGYNLTMTPFDSRCPECGTAVAESLDEAVRPGPAWERRSEIGFTSALWQSARQVFLTPTSFGRSLRVSSEAFSCQRFSAVWLLGILCLGAAATLVLAYWILGDDQVRDEIHIPIAISLITGTACAIGALLCSRLAAIVVGGVCAIQEKRNLLPVANQAACYLFGFLFVWAALGALLVLGVIKSVESGVLLAFAGHTPLSESTWVALLLITPNVAMGLTYVIMIARATKAARYANK